MYQHKTGYSPNEPVATHSRRRYRLLPSRSNHTGPLPDPSLWIVHYTQCDPQDRVPSNVIPVDMRVQQMMSTRQYLHSHGQIVQKEFMLHDRNNWPAIAFPRGAPRGQQMYAPSAPHARVPQTMAYPTQQQHGGLPPSKKAKLQANSNQASASSSVAVLEADDDEDFSRGDFFDLTTPRDISIARYKQNHEWMEEILSSPYAIHQFIPTDLGLGLRGELGALTEGIFDAPYNPPQADVKKPLDVAKNIYVGRLESEKADEFRKRANEQIVQTNAEIEKMNIKHAKRMARFRKGSLISHAEKQLRTAVENPADTGSEIWRLEGRIEEDEEGNVVSKAPANVSDIIAQVEASVGRHAAAVKELIRIQDGGYEEAPAAPSPQAPAVPTPHAATPTSHNGSVNTSQHGSNDSTHSGVLVGDADMDMSNSAAGLLDQYHTGLSSNATPGTGSNFPTPQANLQPHSSTSTPSNLHIASPHPAPPSQEQPSADVTMSNTGNDQVSPDTAGGGDWVVVPSGGVSPGASVVATTAQLTTTTEPSQANPSIAAVSVPASNPSPIPTTTAPTSSANTPGLPDFHTSPNDFADLGDLEGAGDALGNYGGDGDLGDLGLDMDDSAFGEAFHGVEPRIDEGEGMGDGL